MYVIDSRWPVLGKRWRGVCVGELKMVVRVCGFYMVKTKIWTYAFTARMRNFSKNNVENYWGFKYMLQHLACVCRLAVLALCNVTFFQKKSVTAGPNYLNYSVTTHINVPHFHLVPLLNKWVIKKKRRKKPPNPKPWRLYSVPPFVCVYSRQWSSAHMTSLIRGQHIWSESFAELNRHSRKDDVWYRIT